MFTPNRLISATGVLAITLGLALTAMGQKKPPPPQSSAVNTSRSNIKNNRNIKVVEDPPGTVRCVVTGEKIAKDCTKDQVDLLNKALTTSAQKEQATSAQRTNKFTAKPQLSLAPNGSLLCDKKPCTAGDLSDVNKAAMEGINDPIGGIAYTRNASGVMEATSVSQSLTCLPADVKDTEIVQATKGDPLGTRVTVGQKLKDLKARCSKNGTLIGETGNEIIFYRLKNCYGTPPPDLAERVKKQQDELRALSKKGTVIEISCNPSGVPIP